MDGVKKFSRNSKTVARRRRAITRLEQQFLKGTKPYNEPPDSNGSYKYSRLIDIPLTGKDKERINSELTVLKLRI